MSIRNRGHATLPDRPRALTYVSGIEIEQVRLSESLMDELIARKLFTETRLMDLTADGKALAGVLADRHLLNDREIADIEAERTGLSRVNLRSAKRFDAKIVKIVDEELLRSRIVCPVRRDGARVVVATTEVSDELQRQLETIIGEPVAFEIASVSDIRFAIDQTHRALDDVSSITKQFEAAAEDRRTKVDLDTSDAATETDDDAPMVRLALKILTQARRDRASDIHVEPLEDRVRVRFRIDGVLSEVLTLDSRTGASLVSYIKVQSKMSIVDRRRPQDGQFTAVVDGDAQDVRVSTIGTIQGQKCVMRLLDKTRSTIALDRMGMPEDTCARYMKLARAPYGMIICVGPTGSGKSTTLYATLNEIMDDAINVTTIENPVEFIVPTINQIQTNDAAGLTFATGLRSILRQDPDVILVGEIRDEETATTSIQAAMTGHLVLSTLHANSSALAMSRFVDMGIEPFMVASSILGVVSQRLLRRICSSCKETHKPTTEELRFYEESGGAPKEKFYHGKGCGFCAKTGYRDRIGVYELLEMTEDIRRLVIDRAHTSEIVESAVGQGMRTMRTEAIALVEQDLTTISEVIKNVYVL
jgi:type IV pilus assembly protein PilB